MPSEHVIKSYDEELRRVNNTITEMGGLAESQLATAIEAVMQRDSDLAANVVETDAKVDQLQREVDNLAVRVLALRQPMARDLREVFAAIKIASDLERICDYAANVAKRSIVLNQSPPVRPVFALPRMARLAEPLMTEGGTLFTMSYYGAHKVVEHYNLMGPVKAALEATGRYLAYELGAKGIRVHIISPGPLKTRAASGIKDFDELLTEAATKAPARQLVTIDDVGIATAALSADGARLITGETIYVDGGLHIVS